MMDRRYTRAAYKARSKEVMSNPKVAPNAVDVQWAIRDREQNEKDARESANKAEQDKIRSRYVDDNEPADSKNYGR